MAPLIKHTEEAVIAFGNFDGVHLGHLNIIQNVKRLAQGKRSIILTFNPHPKQFFAPNISNFSLTTTKQKISLIKSYGIDIVHPIEFNQKFAQMSPISFIEQQLVNKYNATNIVIGHNCSFGNARTGNSNLLEELSHKYKYHLTKLKPISIDNITCSSSIIRNLLQHGDLKTANKLLSRNFTIEGFVKKGNQKGRSIGFPTANLDLNEYIQPKFGVYSAKTQINDKMYFGVVNIGVRPTLTQGDQVVLEIHIFDFSKNIYNQQISIQLLDFIREEYKFNTIEDLRNQIADDIKLAKQQLKC